MAGAFQLQAARLQPQEQQGRQVLFAKRQGSPSPTFNNDEQSDLASSFSRTIWKTLTGRHVWVIERFKDLLERADEKTVLTSLPFVVKEGSDEFKFQLELIPKRAAHSDYVEIQILHKSLSCPQAADALVSFTVKSKEDRDAMFKMMRQPNAFIRSESRQTAEERWSLIKYGEPKIFPAAFKRSELLNSADTLLPNGELTLVCDVKVTLPNTKVMPDPRSVDDDAAILKSKSQQLRGDIAKLRADNALCDFKLKCKASNDDSTNEDDTLSCHKVILAARSPVFRAMFEHDGTAEAKEDCAEIKDVTTDTMKKLLDFVYTDKVLYLVTLSFKNGLILTFLSG